MQATAARILIGVGRVVGIAIHRARKRIVVAHIGERQHTETHAQVTSSTETGLHIFEIGVLGIHLAAILLKVGKLPGNTHIKDETQRIERRIGSRVDVVHLIVLAKAQSQPVHTAIEATCLVAQLTKAVLAIRRIRAALGKRTCNQYNQRGSCQYLFHLLNVFLLDGVTRANAA